MQGDLKSKDCRWPENKIWNWYNTQPWRCGFNYVPQNVISYTEMWMDYCFDKGLIDQELCLAERIGFNLIRVVLPYIVWEHDGTAFTKRLDEFATICDKHGIKVMFAMFDDCVFGSIIDPVYGKQPDVLHGWYGNGWTPSPGHGIVKEPGKWQKLRNYVQDVIRSFKEDERIWLWDLYNELAICI